MWTFNLFVVRYCPDFHFFYHYLQAHWSLDYLTHIFYN
jgi:hypothetical protein